MVDVNPLDTVKSILNDNWNSANTDSITPTIVKKYEHPKNYQLRPNNDLIYLYSTTTNLSPSGIGNPTFSDVQETLSIDIRSRPSQNNITSDAHARKVLYEVKRILKGNINRPNTGDFAIIDQNIEHNDTSGSIVGLFRYVININLIDYHKQIN